MKRCRPSLLLAVMAVAWEKLVTDGVQFTYDALPALGGGFALGAPQSPLGDSLVPRSAGDAALDTLTRQDAVPLVMHWQCTPPMIFRMASVGWTQYCALTPPVVMRGPAKPALARL